MKFIRAGYTKLLNMFKTFVLTFQTYTNEKNTIRMDRNRLEWPGMTPWINLNGPFILVREQIRHSETGALGPFFAGIFDALFRFRVLYEYIVLYPLSVREI